MNNKEYFSVVLLLGGSILFFTGVWMVDIVWSGKYLQQQFPSLQLALSNGFYSLNLVQAYHAGLYVAFTGFLLSVFSALYALRERTREQSPITQRT